MADGGPGAAVRRCVLVRHFLKSAAVLLLVVFAAVPARAETPRELRAMIVAMAQHFVQEQFMFGHVAGHYHIEFDVAHLHPQPDPGYWAVVGGFISDQNTPNTYVAAVRLVCPAFRKTECWRLEKMALNGKIIIDRKPL